MTLTDFLLARIDEDEAMARAAHDEGVRRYGDDYNPDQDALFFDNGWLTISVPRVLAECEAKRQIVKLHHECGTGHGYCDDSGHGWGPQRNLPLGCADLAHLASVYADHPDFYEALRP